MDARIEYVILLSSQGYFRTLTKTCFFLYSPAAQLQIHLGEAHVIRNAGGSAYVWLPFLVVFLSEYSYNY